ncbi:unnamed protein product [Prunus armeniaca]
MWDCGHQLWDCHVSKGMRSPPSPLARVLGRGFGVVIGRESRPTVRGWCWRSQKVASSGRMKGHLNASTSAPRVPSVPHRMSDTWWKQ